MVNNFRITGRNLQSRQSLLFTLVFLLYFLFILCTGLIPMFFSYISERFFTSVNCFGYINLIFAAVSFFTVFVLFSLVRLGRKRYFLRNACGFSVGADEVFYCFKGKNFLSAVSYSVKFSLVKTAVGFLCFLPFVLSFAFLFKGAFDGTSVLFSFAVAVTAVLFFLSAAVFNSVFASSFFLCDYYFIKGEYISFSHLLGLSQLVMKGRKKKLFKLKMSFLGWFFLCLAVLPLSFVSGYYNQSLAVAAKEFMQ